MSGIQYIGGIAQLYGIYIMFLSIKNFMKLSAAKSIGIIAIYTLALLLISILFYSAQANHLVV